MFNDLLQNMTLDQVLLKLQHSDLRALYGQLSKAAAIALTLPMHTAEVERLFSTLKRVCYLNKFIL